MSACGSSLEPARGDVQGSGAKAARLRPTERPTGRSRLPRAEREVSVNAVPRGTSRVGPGRPLALQSSGLLPCHRLSKVAAGWHASQASWGRQGATSALWAAFLWENSRLRRKNLALSASMGMAWSKNPRGLESLRGARGALQQELLAIVAKPLRCPGRTCTARPRPLEPIEGRSGLRCPVLRPLIYDPRYRLSRKSGTSLRS